MANLVCDNVYTTSFTPREYQIELLDAAKDRNTIICLSKPSTKTFISVKLIHEFVYESAEETRGLKYSVYVTGQENVSNMYACVKHLTDLKVAECKDIGEFSTYQLNAIQCFVTTADVLVELLSRNIIKLSYVNLLVIDECHKAINDSAVQYIMSEYSHLLENTKPRIVGLASRLFQAGDSPAMLRKTLETLEKILHSKAETASDVVTLLRYSLRPYEIFVECGRPIPNSLQDTLMMYVFRARCFLDDHRFDPYEMYQDEFREDLQKIPDPKIDPHIIFDDFLDVVDTLGCWPANRAALALLIKIEKLKVKTPYERHFLLLCMTSTVMVEIRCICEEAFQDLSETERIMLFSAPKILRLIELIKQFKPESSTSEIKSEMNCLQESKVNCVDFSQLIDNEININKDSNFIESENKNKTDDKTNGISIEFANETDIIEGIHAHLKKLRNTMNIGDLTSLDLLNGKLNDNNSPIELNVSSNINTNTEKHLNKLEIDKNGVLPIDNWDGVQSDEELEEIKTNKLTYFKHKDASFPDEYFYGTQIFDSCDWCWKRNDTFQTTDSRGQGRRRHRGISRKIGNFTKQLTENDTLCGIIFVQKAFTAKILFFALVELSRNDPDYAFISAQFTVDKTADPVINIREAEREHRTQEEVLRKFRTHECNLLVATSVLEEGIDLPKCNLVIHFDQPMTYRSYVQCKSRARAPGAYHVFLLDLHDKEDSVNRIARYYEIEKILLSKCADMEPTEAEHRESDKFNICVAPYRTLPTTDAPFVDTLSAVALVNKYCAKLPSDTFTKLAPIWTEDIINDEGEKLYRCKLRLPINSPVKEEIIGPLMKDRVLARRVAALRTCRVLHEAGELDDQLQPIGKEGFRASESDWDDFPLDADDEMLAKDSSEPRPGTTKRRQYYYKRIAESLTNCKPLENEPAYLYSIDMILTCPLPEEQNTRGRRIYPPEESPQGFGILTSKRIPKICSFPIFTRSGEVGVQLKQCDVKVILNSERSRKVCVFLNYVFTSVLRLQKYLMVFDPNDSENSYFIVPTMTCNGNVSVDWNFLDKIDENKDLRPSVVSEEDRKDFIFEPVKYHDAVVMPWYRNQDQPQYFYVAEICDHLSPKSSFPGTDYSTFEDYYFKKYDIKVQNTKQPLLDVDHTSARLNFLTPRYVNRKGVALPTSSEETKRAKRENLEQKQILVPELCTVHPFPASLWRKAVCLPCILYRVNALLLADEIRKRVAQDLALGTENLKLDFDWPRLDFGWNLADVFRKVKQDKQALPNPSSDIKSTTVEVNSEIREKENNALEQDKSEESDNSTKKDKDWMEIGTWSNDMAETFDNDSTKSDDFCRIRYGSPTMRPYNSLDDNYYDWDSDDSYTSEIDSSEDSQKGNGLRIEFKGDNVAEAIEDDRESSSEPKLLMLTESSMNYSDYYSDWTPEQINDNDLEDRVVLENHKHRIISSNFYFDIDEKILIERKSKNICEPETLQQHEVQEPLVVEPLIKSNQETKMKGREICKIDSSNVDVHKNFSFDFQPNLTEHPGPSPSIILQALTMSNANDGINLERLETIGDSFLKYAITTYLYCTYENVHEGKLSHLRSKQVSNLNLYRLGRRKILGESMIATKFEPHDNWLPPCYYVPSESEEALSEDAKQVSDDETQEEGEPLFENSKALSCFIPYNLLTQHSIPDKSIADCVEALIGAYLIECGPRGALLFMAWLGIRVLPLEYRTWKDKQLEPVPLRPPGSTISEIIPDGSFKQIVYGILRAPQSPLLRHVRDPEEELSRLLQGYNEFEHTINYHFRDRSYLLQALTHTSYFPNRLTDCYQRLEFLGDAILDYLITRHLYEDSRQHSPGALTDLRSALVNNTIFASLAVRFGFHKYFRHLSPGLHEVMSRFVRIQESNGHTITEEYCMIEQDESEEAEDVEVPKALGDVFESVAGAVFLDSGMSLDAVWKVYYRMMRTEIELFSMNVPKSPIRELLELEPETTKFSKSEKLADGKRVRVSVEVFGKGIFKGIGRNYRIAKCTAAKCALKHLKKRGLVCRNNYVSSAYS